tara:strand:- start:339 stop:1022 length:684 start_codon:yes stop_codon:yes gene_type:complete
MPHQPGHKYIVDGTNQEYFGKVVKVGNDLFTTSGGTLEGNSYMVTEVQEVTDNESVTTDDTNVDKVTQFTVGVGHNHPMYHPIYSTQTYYFENSSVVQMNTPLHRHSKPKKGQTEFMTQHSMAGPDLSVPVFSVIPSQLNRNVIRREMDIDGLDSRNGTGIMVGLNTPDETGQENNQTQAQTMTATTQTTSGGQLTGGPSNQQQTPPAQTGGGMSGGGMSGGGGGGY